MAQHLSTAEQEQEQESDRERGAAPDGPNKDESARGANAADRGDGT
jgi:hypothetical protein